MATTNIAVVVAIDFGTTYSGYAFSTKVDYKRDSLKIYGNEPWLVGEGFSTEKTPTTILFDPNKEFKSFGYEAEDEYAKLAENEEHKKWYYFRRFKLQLLRNDHRRIRRGMKIRDETKKEMSAIKVFSEAIRYLVDHFHVNLKKTVPEIQKNEIKCLVTVPAIWDDGAKQFMRVAANLAGVPDDRLELALEPEAAAIFSIKEMSLRNGGRELFPLSHGTTFMIVDCGGGTVDITVNYVMENGTLKEVCALTGEPWGGITVDKAFVSLLKEIFGKEMIQNFKDTYSTEYIELMRSFEFKKRKFSGDTMVIRISEDLISLVKEEVKGQSLESKVSLSKYRDTISVKARRLHIKPTVIRGLFEEARTNVIQQIKHLLAQYPQIKTIFMVGGFSDSEVIYQAIADANKSKIVIRPQEGRLAIVKEAVIYGHDKFSIISRISPFTYGVNIAIPFDDKIHPEWIKSVRGGRALYEEALKVFIRCGDVLVPGHTKVIHEFNPQYPDGQVANISVYKSKTPEPSCISDIGCIHVGDIQLSFQTHNGSHSQHGIKSNRIVEIIMYFGHTELTVEARESGTNNKIEAKYDFL